MNEQQVKDNAPDGATHYINHNGVKYYKLDKNGTVYIYVGLGIGGYQCLNLHISETVLKPL